MYKTKNCNKWFGSAFLAYNYNCKMNFISRKNLVITLVIFFLFSWLAIKVIIAISTVNTIKDAKSSFCGDSVEALCSMALTDTISLERRNKAIWALGQLKDQRAIPVLNSLLTDQKCDHEKYVCQRKVKKSIKKIEGRFWNSWPLKGN